MRLPFEFFLRFLPFWRERSERLEIFWKTEVW